VSQTIACPCGAARVTISGEPVTQFFCHCADCRLVHGAAYTLEAMYRARDVEAAGETAVFTLKTTPRVFCAKCGVRLYADLPESKLRGVNGVLLPGFKAELHINCESALAPVRDMLPKYATRPAAFGGDDALVEW